VRDSIAEPVNGAGSDIASQPTRSGRGTRGKNTRTGSAESRRFFLAQPGTDGGTPRLGKEFETEASVTAESFKTGLTFYVVSEWRGAADFSKKVAQLTKDAVVRVKKIE